MKLINCFLESNTAKETDDILKEVMVALDCGNFTYNYYPNNFQRTREVLHVVCTQSIQKWQVHYQAQSYDKVDPIFHRLRASALPLCWQLKDEFNKHGKLQQQFFSDAMEFGFSGGFGVPIHAPCGEFANLVIQDISILILLKKYPEIAYQLQLIAYHYHARVNFFLQQGREKNFENYLTKREIECLQLTAQHSTAKEIAQFLKITPRTVSFHIENAIKKLKVKNKYQAVSKANDLQLIS